MRPDPSELRTSADASRALPSHGPRWQSAIDYGIDSTLIEHNLALSVTERILQLDDMLATYYALRPRGDE